MTPLSILWFVLIAVLWVGYLTLEGFDFGVGMLLKILGRDERERRAMLRALEEAMATNRLIFVVTQKNIQIEDPTPDDIFNIGTVCEVLQILKMSDGTLKALVEGLNRAQ